MYYVWDTAFSLWEKTDENMKCRKKREKSCGAGLNVQYQYKLAIFYKKYFPRYVL